MAYERRIDAGIALMEALPMPTVAVVEGWAVGGGLAIATACDFRIATPGARFGVPIARTLGNCLSIANVARLVAAFGAAARAAHAAAGRDDRRRGGAGLRLPAGGRARRRSSTRGAASCAQRLAALAPVTQRVSKEALRRLLRQRPAGRRRPDPPRLRQRGFPRRREAFVAKRPPAWQGALGARS